MPVVDERPKQVILVDQDIDDSRFIKDTRVFNLRSLCTLLDLRGLGEGHVYMLSVMKIS